MYILQDALGYAAVKIPVKKCSGLKYGLTGLYCVTTAGFFRGGGRGAGGRSICLEASHMTSSQISVSKASHVATLNFKVMECNSTMYPEETEGGQPANHEGTSSHHARCSLSHQ